VSESVQTSTENQLGVTVRGCTYHGPEGSVEITDIGQISASLSRPDSDQLSYMIGDNHMVWGDAAPLENTFVNFRTDDGWFGRGTAKGVSFSDMSPQQRACTHRECINGFKDSTETSMPGWVLESLSEHDQQLLAHIDMDYTMEMKQKITDKWLKDLRISVSRELEKQIKEYEEKPSRIAGDKLISTVWRLYQLNTPSRAAGTNQRKTGMFLHSLRGDLQTEGQAPLIAQLEAQLKKKVTLEDSEDKRWLFSGGLGGFDYDGSSMVVWAEVKIPIRVGDQNV